MVNQRQVNDMAFYYATKIIVDKESMSKAIKHMLTFEGANESQVEKAYDKVMTTLSKKCFLEGNWKQIKGEDI